MTAATFRMDYVSVPAFAVAFALHMLMGAIWYHPKVFGTAFSKLAHSSSPTPPPADAMVAAVAGTAICMPVFALILRACECRTAGEASLCGMVLGLFFDAGLNVSSSVFESRPFALFLLHRAYHIVSLSVVGAALGVLCTTSSA